MYPRPEINTPSDPQYTLHRALDRITAIRAREAGSVRANGARGIRGPRVANRLGQDGLDGHHNIAELIQGAAFDSHVSIGYANIDGQENMDSHGDMESHGNMDSHGNAGDLSQSTGFGGHGSIGYDNINGFGQLVGLDNLGEFGHGVRLDGVADFDNSVGLDDLAGPDHVGKVHDSDFPRGTHPTAEPFSPSPHLNTRGGDGFSLSGRSVSRSDAALHTAGLGTAEVDAAEVVSTPSVPGARGCKRAAPSDFYIPVPVRRVKNGLQVSETVGQTTPPPRTCSPPPTPVRRWTRRQSRTMAHPGWYRRGRSGN